MAQRGCVIDVHAHVTPQRFQKAVLAGVDWHGLTPADGELDNPRNRWGPERRIEEMDALGVDVQVLSPTDCFYQYHRDPATTARIAAECNDEVAEMVRAHPARFLGLGTLPMQDVDRTLAEMRRGIEELRLVGFMIDDHVEGLTYDHEMFDPVWAAAAQLRAFILVHQGRLTSVTSRTAKYFLPNSIGNLVDRALTFACLVHGGVMDRHPGAHRVPRPCGGVRALRRRQDGQGLAGETQSPWPRAGSSEHLCRAVLLRHRHLHGPQPAVPRRRGRRGTGAVRDRLAGAHGGRRPRAAHRAVAVLTDDERQAILRRNSARVFSGVLPGRSLSP